MRHRRKNKTKIKVSKKDRIKSADDLQYNACLNLVSEILYQTYNTYKSSLIFWTNNREKYKKIRDEIIAYEKYKEDKLKYISCKNKKRKWEDDIEFINYFESLEKLTRPKKSHYDFYWRYIYNRQELDACRWFYHSERYRVFCLDNYIDGDVVMRRAEEEIKGELK